MFLGLLDPHPDPLDRSTDPRILIRIRTQMSRIHNNGKKQRFFFESLEPRSSNTVSEKFIVNIKYNFNPYPDPLQQCSKQDVDVQ
jgi:hypothetical protein